MTEPGDWPTPACHCRLLPSLRGAQAGTCRTENWEQGYGDRDWLSWGGEGTLHFLPPDWKREAEPGVPNPAPHPPPGLPSRGLCWDTQGTPALAEPPSDKAASPALAALGAGEEFT